MKIFSNNKISAGAKSICFGVLLLFAYILTPQNASAQCDSITAISLVGKPSGSWTSSPVSRKNKCCGGGSSSSDCIKFQVTLDTMAMGLKIDVSGGAGATYYYLNCTDSALVGDEICVSGAGPHNLVFCKPGSNKQTYTITSVSRPYLYKSPTYISPSCPDTIRVVGLDPTQTITWSSISGSAYDNNLSCTTGCTSTIVSPSTGFPSYVDYRVCGTPLSDCFPGTFCDTVRVYYYPKLTVSISPSAGYRCGGGSTAITFKAAASGGKPPYTYSWNTGGTDSTKTVATNNSYIVTAKDALGCQVAKDTILVTSATKPAPTITGSSIICIYEEGSYLTTANANYSYNWSVSGGIITSGSGTNAIGVVWSSTGSKTISLTVTNTVTGCTGTTSKTVTVHSLPTTPPIQH